MSARSEICNMEVKYYKTELILGDCLEVMRGLSDKSIDAVITDPPYGIDYQSAWRIDKALWKPKIQNDLVPFVGWGKELGRIAKKCAYIFYRWDKQNEFINELELSGMIIKSQIIWDKVIHGMGDLTGAYSPQHENILFAAFESFQFPDKRPASIIKQRRVSSDKLVHPNEKPVALIKKLIYDSTVEGDTVLDFTMGSGTTGIDCVELGRNFIGIEIDPKYYKIAEERIAKAKLQMRLF